jgi:antitoxin component of RelBE/YafQ-DinJ toxin-antitoxin module
MTTPRGKKAKADKIVLLQVHVKTATKEALAKAAEEEEITVSDLVRRLLREWAENRARSAALLQEQA